jgi:uncharacterized protein (TIGR03437 family)
MDGQDADVIYAGSAPGLVAGVTQINFRLPPFFIFLTGNSVTVTAGGSSSSPAKIFVTR